MLFAAPVLITACGEGRGFALPEGNLNAGELAFTTYNCNDCHSIGTIQFAGSDDDAHIPLGGETTKLKTYGELVTSVINPSHKVSSRYQEIVDTGNEMRSYNDIMTVQELVDIVTFLQSEYHFTVPETHYPYY
jgi:hypothetical protein